MNNLKINLNLIFFFFVDECTLFRFHFWKWGNWIEVVVDDRLPFLADNNGNLLQPPQLAFSRSNRPQFFWVSLLEKGFILLLLVFLIFIH